MAKLRLKRLTTAKKHYFSSANTVKLARWSNGNVFDSGAGDLRLKSRARQIGHSVANDSGSLLHFFERSCVARA